MIDSALRVARTVFRLLLPLWLVGCPVMGAHRASAAENPMRVAVLPFAPTDPDPDGKLLGEAIADFLQSQLRTQPGIDWVERDALDKLLAESELHPSSITLGRLLKADALIHGSLGPLTWDDPSMAQKRHKRQLTLEITDLTNANVLAAARIDVEMRLAASGKMEPAALEKFADQARGLLLEALAEKRAAAKAAALAPIFFANAGASARLDGWEALLLEGFESAARAFPQMRMLRFRAAAQASGEQNLALLGLIDANPAAWQTAAQGYLWGSYRELPAEAPTAFEDIRVEAEVYLWMGDQPPQRFVRQFAVKDFGTAAGALIREVLDQAARLGRPAPANHAEQIAAMIFGHLGEMIDDGFFTKDGQYRYSSARMALSTYESETEIEEAIRRQPFGAKKLAYCKRALDLACFFDPQNARMQLLRALLPEHVSEAKGQNPDDALPALAACVTQLQRMLQQRNSDMPLFAHGAGYVFQHWGNTPQFSLWNDQPAPSAKTMRQRERLLRDFRAFFIAQTPEIFRRFDAAGLARVGRQHALRWLESWLSGDAAPESKFQFFEAVWPQVGPYFTYAGLGWNVNHALDQLMQELGDRKRVQAVLMKYPPAQELIAKDDLEYSARRASGRGRASAAPLASSSPAPASPPSAPRWGYAAGEPLLEGIRLAATPFYPVTPPVPSNDGRTMPDEFWRITGIAGYGDQLLLDAADTFGNGPHDYFSYQLSTHEMRPVNASRKADSLYTAQGRAIYRKGDAVGWTDLLSGESGEFLPENGLPVGAPSMLGLAGRRYAAVADGVKRVAGFFDWKTHQWITPPAPPPASDTAHAARPPAQAARAMSRAEARPIIGTDEAIYFPEWRTLYRIDSQKWQEVPPLPTHRPNYSDPRRTVMTLRRRPLNADRGELMTDGDLWQWNASGISQYSLEKGSVVWKTEASDLIGMWEDGPYFWLAFGLPLGTLPISFGEGMEFLRGSPESCALLLWDRSSHQPLGAAWVSGRIHSLCVNDHELWLGMEHGPIIFHADKADLYAALGQPAPAPPKRPARPAVFDAGNSALYDAILREDMAAARQLLQTRKGSIADLQLGLNAAPALAVAAWTGNADLAQLFLARGARMADALGAKPALRNDFPTEMNLDYKWTLLTAAARRRDPAMTRLLLGAGAPATAEAMRAAAHYRRTETIVELAKAGAPLEPFLQRINTWRDKSWVRRLLNANLKLTPAEKTQLEALAPEGAVEPTNPALADDPAALYQAIRQALNAQNEDRALELLRLAPAVGINGPEARGAFHSAIESICFRLVEAFLERGTDPNMTARERQENTRAKKSPEKFGRPHEAPLIAALINPKISRILLERGANPTMDNDPKFTYLERVAAQPAGKAELLAEALRHYPAANSKMGYGTHGGAALCAAAAGWNNNGSYLRPDERLILAQSRIDAIRVLIEHGVPPSAPNREGYTTLHLAVALRNPAMACLLAGDGADLAARDLAGRTIFDPPYTPYAKARNSFEKTLQDYSPRSETESQGQKRLLAAMQSRPTYEELREAVAQDDLRRAEELLRRGAPVDAPIDEPPRRSAQSADTAGLLFTAANRRSHPMAALLLNHGANPNVGESGATPKTSRNPLLSSVFGPMKQIRIVRLTAALNPGKTPLMAAAEAGDAPLARLLLDRGANPAAQDQFHRTAAEMASDPALARAIEESARARAQAEAFVQASEKIRFDAHASLESMEQILRSTPAALALRDEWNTPYLAVATRQERNPFGELSLEANTQKLALLQRHGFPLNSLDEYGLSPLHWAVLENSPELAAGLVKAGFNPALADARGVTALELASTIAGESDRAEMMAALKGDARK